MEQNNNLDYAWTMLLNKAFHIFLTGNAGTGKSTLIRKFIQENMGKCIVLAPTGIAAVHIGGVTIHRFCHFPARPINQNAIKWLDPRQPFDFAKRRVIERAEYLIIDEASMIRADIMDQIAWFFKKNYPDKPPFAGLKVILVGDLDQLPPVMANDEEIRMIRTRYKSEFFFSAKVWEQCEFKTIALTHVFRQSDPVFVNMLNDIKNNRLAPFDLDKLNRMCLKDDGLKPEDGVMLCSTNAIASEVNNEMVYRLPGDPIRLIGTKEGDFNEKNCPVEPIIDLKIGCRVMTMRNDPEGMFFNGSIGVLVGLKDQSTRSEEKRELNSNRFDSFDEFLEEERRSLKSGDEESIINHPVLEIRLDNGNLIELGRVDFESIDYVFDEKTDKIKHTITGKFSQYPIKIAYALTIHKSQGQTFDKVIVDLGDRGAFAHGQVYVALSRCRSLEGLTLRRKINQKDLIYNPSVLEFNKI